MRSRLEDDRPLIVQAVIDLADERIVLPLSRAMGARERTKLGVPRGEIMSEIRSTDPHGQLIVAHDTAGDGMG